VRITTDRLGLGHYLTGYYLHGLAALYLKANDLATAENYARQALAVYAQALPVRHLYVSSTRRLLGEILLQRGSLAAGEAEIRSALDTEIALAGSDRSRIARTQASLAWALILRDEAAEGEPMLVAARAELLASVGPDHPFTQWASAHLVQYLRAHHRDDAAVKILASPHPG
jgi:hypothetical protein